ncbi:uncharacterized protein LOC111331484 isoform X2 [Stylophora pistillata]|uniref:uncharacterized protein LOC111331484 isoform X2 n=1 Tax=Stylophora pistillata TaxID=50429 RepID=UPI000C05147D|nr:uncharacterized protein LOC111331484 isoform X2 [Stylophora pistillata]
MSLESAYISLTDMSGSERPSEQISSRSVASISLDDPMDKVKRFVVERGLMLEDCFQDYDPLRKGHVSSNDFKEAFSKSFGRLLTEEEVEEIQSRYRMVDNMDCYDWPKFLHDAEKDSNQTSAEPNHKPTRRQKEAVLKNVIAQLMKSKQDISDLLDRTPLQDSNGNEQIGHKEEDVLQFLKEIVDKEDLEVIIAVYGGETSFKWQEFLKDLQNMKDCHKKGRPTSRRNKVSPQSNGFTIDIPEEKIQKTQKGSLSFRQSRRRFTVSYETLVWIVFLVSTALCVIDRFVLKGDMVLGRSGKLPKRLWGNHLGETATNVVWAITARMIITSQNLMFYTMMCCLPNFICETAPNWITIDGIRNVHSRIHAFAGIFLLAIPSVAHVLLIFVPPLIDGTQLLYYPPSTFNYSKYPDHLNWTKFWDPAALQGWTFNDHKGVHLTSDEIYRFMLVIVIFCLIVPLSRSNYANKRSYSLAMALHVFAGIWYAIDNIRKITHGLSQVANLPILVLWCIDKILSILYYRRNCGHVVRKEVVGDNEYVIMYVKLDSNVKHAVGDVYYLLHKGENTGMLPQRSHPFTTFANMSQDSTWDIGFVISIMEDEEQMCLPWTKWLATNDEAITFHTWGPYRSSVWKLYDELTNVTNGGSPSHLVLFATGSGCGYILDVLSCLANKYEPLQHKSQTCKQTKIDIFYSVRCKEFYEFLRRPIEDLLRKIKEKDVATITFTFYVTGSDVRDVADDTTESPIQLIQGRINFEKALKVANKKSCCYFIGRPVIAKEVVEICQRKGIRLVKDFTNGRGSQEDRRLLMKYLKRSFWVIFVITAVCVAISLVIDVKSIKNSLEILSTNRTK